MWKYVKKQQVHKTETKEQARLREHLPSNNELHI